MINPEHYMFADLSITEIDEPLEVQDYSDDYLDHYYEDMDPWGNFKAMMYQMYQDAKASGPADDFGDELLEYENLDDLTW